MKNHRLNMLSVILGILFISLGYGCSYSTRASADKEDADGDGYCFGLASCETSSLVKGDCDDYDRSVNPGAVELASDSVDNDCDGAIDEADADADGSGTESTDDDGDGFAELDNDCDDGNASVYPGAVEITGDGIDQDCNGADSTSTDPAAGIDKDGDGYTSNVDCNDENDSVYPDAREVANNGVDENCDGSDLTITILPHTPEIPDNGCTAADAIIYYRDNDADGYGTSDLSVFDSKMASCDDLAPDGYASNNTDCNDSSFVVRPGMMDYSCPGDGVDNNCDGLVDNGINICPGGGI